MNTRTKAILTAFSAVAIAILFAGCASTGTNFDQSRVSQIETGKTTEAELLQMFGEPSSRSLNSEGIVGLTWMYNEAQVTGQTFIPYAGAFLGGTRSAGKTLNVALGSDGTVSTFSSSDGGTETRRTLQSVPTD